MLQSRTAGQRLRTRSPGRIALPIARSVRSHPSRGDLGQLFKVIAEPSSNLLAWVGHAQREFRPVWTASDRVKTLQLLARIDRLLTEESPSVSATLHCVKPLDCICRWPPALPATALILAGTACSLWSGPSRSRLPYSLYGSTLVGALRHADFVPWEARAVRACVPAHSACCVQHLLWSPRWLSVDNT